jgi:hypothetical protein
LMSSELGVSDINDFYFFLMISISRIIYILNKFY